MSETGNVAQKILVIAYGNSLRGDDGIAWRTAEELKRTLPASAGVICVHQLTPELAEPASCADLVIFLDASSEGQPGTVSCRPLSPESGKLHFSHHLKPSEILVICDRLYSAKTRAFLISLCGECFDHGEQFTPAVISAVPRAVGIVENIVAGHIPMSVGQDPTPVTARPASDRNRRHRT